MRTFCPPLPSTIFPVRLSTTLAWNHPPRRLSTTLPSAPHSVTARTQRPQRSLAPHPRGQNGSSAADVSATVKAPRRAARRPVAVTPPLVPGGTTRKVREVMRRGFDLERMPSSEAKVSAATAA